MHLELHLNDKLYIRIRVLLFAPNQCVVGVSLHVYMSGYGKFMFNRYQLWRQFSN